MKLFELENKSAIITGAGRGIGAATAELFASAGAAVAVVDKYENYAVRTAETIRKSGGKAIAVTCDVTDEDDVEEVFAGVVKEFGGLDILVNNAGMAIRKPAVDVPLAEWQQVIDLNLTALFVCSRVAARFMRTAKKWAGDRIRVNAVAPTFVNTDFTAQIFTNPAVLEQVEKHTPLGVLPEVGDIAAAILFLASPAARCITGITLPVDSGYLAR